MSIFIVFLVINHACMMCMIEASLAHPNNACQLISNFVFKIVKVHYFLWREGGVWTLAAEYYSFRYNVGW